MTGGPQPIKRTERMALVQEITDRLFKRFTGLTVHRLNCIIHNH